MQDNSLRNRDNSSLPNRRRPGKFLCCATGFVAVLALTALPLDLTSPDLNPGWSKAHAGNHGGGGGGNSGGGGGGGGNSGGGGGNSGGGGGGSTGGSAEPGGTSAPDGIYGGGGINDRDRALILEQGVTLAQFTTRISKRYPADNVALHMDRHQAITFFTEVRGLAGKTIYHRWIYNGTVEYEADFKIRGPTWKVWSSQILPPEKPGIWSVAIVDDGGEVLLQRSLDYEPAKLSESEGRNE